MTALILLTSSCLGGFIGAILGLGGGIIVIPVLTLVLHVHIRYAIAASLVSIVATSSGAAASYLRDHLTNLRIGVFLEIGTVTGAVAGFLLSNAISTSHLFLYFGLFLLFSAAMMFRARNDNLALVDHPWSKRLGLSGTYPDSKGQPVTYKVAHVPLALFFMFIAGGLSALLGIGSGVLKVLAMDGAMKLPIKVSSATSNFMIGVTATASAGAYFLRGDVRPEITAPVALGIIVGSWLGAKAMVRLPSSLIRKIFVVVLCLIAAQMISKGLA
jgi:uncharacterized membrane protein YfcA